MPEHQNPLADFIGTTGTEGSPIKAHQCKTEAMGSYIAEAVVQWIEQEKSKCQEDNATS